MISPWAAIYPNWGFQFCQLVVIDLPERAILQNLVSVRKHIQFSLLKSMTWKMAKMKSNGIVMQNEGGKQREFFFRGSGRQWQSVHTPPPLTHLSGGRNHPIILQSLLSSCQTEPFLWEIYIVLSRCHLSQYIRAPFLGFFYTKLSEFINVQAIDNPA